MESLILILGLKAVAADLRPTVRRRLPRQLYLALGSEVEVVLGLEKLDIRVELLSHYSLHWRREYIPLGVGVGNVGTNEGQPKRGHDDAREYT